MFFRNLTLFRFPPTFGGLFDTPVAAELADIEGALRECALKSVGPQELSSRGFVPPLGRDSESFMHRVGDAAWIAVGGEDKILPGAVVNDLLAKKLDELEEREGVRPGSRARKRLKEELVTELLPKAFVQPVRTDAYFDLARGFIAVDTSSRKAAESVVSEVRRAAGSFPALPINAEVAPRTILTGWLAGDALPEGLTLGE
ncbi:MAG: recombination-associated protein RdgC, partial [Lysobacter sp.]|nr:recombination-associated protein RdgC [Lysobacter sp.]